MTLPGTPFVIVGHNQHVAWAFTNLFADVQDVYIEQTRGTGDGEQFQGSDGQWHPVLHRREVIRVHDGLDVTLDVPETVHGGAETPIISGPDEHLSEGEAGAGGAVDDLRSGDGAGAVLRGGLGDGLGEHAGGDPELRWAGAEHDVCRRSGAYRLPRGGEDSGAGGGSGGVAGGGAGGCGE